MPTIKCPACAARLDMPAAICPKCKFSLPRLDTKFGTVPLHTSYLTDRAKSLTLEQLARLRESLQRFEVKFPQVLFSVFVTDLPDGSSIREFTFWLANRAHFSSVESAGAENFDLLLVIEPARRSAALTVGYGLEKYLTEDDLRDVLDFVEPPLLDNKLERAIRICIEQLTRVLYRACKAAARIDKKIERVSAGEW
jgi:uncharacterized membrane protein YgcG